jgi:hypothetical protein
LRHRVLHTLCAGYSTQHRLTTCEETLR